jgi:hypothetical protein
MAKPYIKRTVDSNIVWYGLEAEKDSPSYQKLKVYADNKGLKYIHRGGNFYVEATGITPPLLKKYGCNDIEGLCAYVLRQSDKTVLAEVISCLNAKETRFLWDITMKEEECEHAQEIIVLCFNRISFLEQNHHEL